jgi:hypothetical protein
MRAITGMASAACVSRGEGVPPLSFVARASCPRIAGKMPATRKGGLGPKGRCASGSPHRLGEYPGEVVPLGDIGKQSKWSG